MNEISIEILLENIHESVKSFLNAAKGKKQFAIYGSMGVGKTTFITAICKELGALDLVSSPTFSILNEYKTKKGETIFHFDFYRIDEPEELFDIGFEEYLSVDNWCFIEWPEIAESLIPDSFVKVYIEAYKTGERVLKMEH